MHMLCTWYARAMMSGSKSGASPQAPPASTPSRQHCRLTCSGVAFPHTCTLMNSRLPRSCVVAPSQFHAVTSVYAGCNPVNPRLQPYASQVLKSHPDNFKLDYALSRESKNKDGGKMYIQDKVAEYSDEVFTRMDNVRPPHTYTQGCGMEAWG